ncbi:F-box protein At2g17036-like [Magnolia sinica]|uniref:F-box protein At2g17036-like n=1 Tax=Magnolia sinica TaxID=86752 RepID=UPI00265833FA|nr:F-box protein At2g17036-like [Magnolia sinica]
MADWAHLNRDVLELIAKRLYLTDYQRFSAVCSSWRSLILERSNCKFPCLVLSDDDKGPETHAFFRLFDDKIIRLELPEIHGMRCCGSSHGWLITASNNSESLHLLNPFARLQIQLPPPSKFPFHQFTNSPQEPINTLFIHKAIISSDPASSPDFIVMAVYSETHKLAFLKKGDENWRHVDTSSSSGVYILDLIYHKGKFYAVSQDGRVLLCHLEGMNPRTTEIAPSPIKDVFFQSRYIVESLSGELLQVCRSVIHRDGIIFINDKDLPSDDDNFQSDDDDLPSDDDVEARRLNNEYYPHETDSFKVFKLEETSEEAPQQRWVELTSLGEDTLFFLGQNASLSLSLRDFPSFQGKGNRIYFSDDYYEDYFRFPEDKCPDVNCTDFVVGSLEDGSIKPFLPHGITHSGLTPPIWLMPNPS